MDKILIELILTNQCNKRCEYCDLDFQNAVFSDENILNLDNFIKNNPAEYTINFFWWEPLLQFEKLQKVVKTLWNKIKKFTIGTNGVMLNQEYLEYFKNNNIFIYLSVDNISCWKDLNLELISKFAEIIQINFINDPNFLFNSLSTFEKVLDFWFQNIAFMPVFSTKKWEKSQLWELLKIYQTIKNISNNIQLNTYGYFNWVAIEKQFILDTDGNFYQDLDSLLWLQKQYSQLNPSLKQEINTQTKLLNISELNISLELLLKKYNIEEILKLVFEIPKQSWHFMDYKIIDKILENGTQKR